MREYINKFRSMFHSPGIQAVLLWSKCVHIRVIGICLLSAFATVLSLAFTLATKGLVDGAVSSDMAGLRRSGILLGGLLLFRHLIYVLQARIRITASAELQMSLQGMLVKEILGKDYARLKGFHSGELVNRVFSDMAVVKGGMLNILPNLIGMLFSFAGAAAILISMDWHFVILMMIGGVLGLGLVLLFRRPMKERHKRMQEAEGALHANVQESLENIRLIKSSSSEKRVLHKIGIDQEHLSKEQIRQGLFSFRMNESMGLVFDFSWLFCMIWGCLNIFQGRLTYGSLAAVIQLIGRIQGPIANAVSIAGQTYGVISSAERLLEVTDLPEEDQGEVLTDFDQIQLDNITFVYDDGIEEVLQSISWTIHKGDFMALTGMSGGGKTSLFQLLLGIYKPTSGKLTFSLGEKKVAASRGTRGLFAYVPQGNTLFSGTLRDNLTLFTDDATEEEIMKAVKAACLDYVVSDIGLDAVLGERGIGLSEGQAQRVAVARALLSKAPVLLLDEATSALDEKTEAKLLDNISRMRDKTCIIVTHRRAALDICDYTLHIADGKMTKE
ncbi:MAG: ABC transporter ATP-binding protein [Blautia sp.]|nr:ABC transporter ATP-binding protein [Blautia sp.]